MYIDLFITDIYIWIQQLFVCNTTYLPLGVDQLMDLVKEAHPSLEIDDIDTMQLAEEAKNADTYRLARFI